MRNGRYLMVLGVFVGCLFSAVSAAPVTKGSTKDVRRERLIKYILESHGETLRNRKWIVRSMAVLSLARVDEPRVTDLLLDALTKPYSFFARAGRREQAETVGESVADPRVRSAIGAVLSSSGTRRMGDYIVQVMAWEALHARNGSLNEAQRKRWIEGTIKLARAGQFRGTMRASMFRLLTPSGNTRENVKAFSDMFERTNSLNPVDGVVLNAMRDALRSWRDHKLVKSLVQAVGGNRNNAIRADYLLRAFDANVPSINVKSTETSMSARRRAHQQWAKWFVGQDMTGDPPAMKAYAGKSRLIPAAEKVENPDDRKWLDSLEIGDLRRSQLDICFVVDSTGSMKQAVEWIKRDVRKMMTALGLVGRNPRASVVFYRDHGDAYVTQLHALTSNGQRLAQAIARAKAHGGADIPEAVFDGLHTARYKQEWSAGRKGYRAIVLIGDAPPHARDMKRIEKLVTESRAKDFVFHCIKARTNAGSSNLSSFDQIAKWGGGKSVWVDFTDNSLMGDIYRGARHVRVAASRGENDSLTRPDRVIVREVLRGVLTQSYHGYVGSFSNVLMEYLETHIPEKRRLVPITPKRRGGGGGGRRGGGGKKKGPQDR